MQDKGLIDEFVDTVRERYGFQAPIKEPALWMRTFVEVLALTETYLGYGEPVDFPFADRLPPLAIVRRKHFSRDQWLDFLLRSMGHGAIPPCRCPRRYSDRHPVAVL